jgi:putative transposase
MIRGQNESGKSGRIEAKADSKVSGEDGRTCAGSRKARGKFSLPAGGDSPSAALAVEAEVPSGRHCLAPGDEAGPQAQGATGSNSAQGGGGEVLTGPAGDFDRTAGNEKKESLGLDGPLYERHLSKGQRQDLLTLIEEARAKGEPLTRICEGLQLHRRSYYRWRARIRPLTGGGGRNKIRPKEERRVVAIARKHPSWRCRRIAYHLEKVVGIYIGKTKVAEILKANGLNHEFIRRRAAPKPVPGEMLLHEPWRPNLLWGMDWTWVRVNGSFMFLLVLLDWYSRKILSWGLYHKITQFEVVTVVTEATATERIDMLPEGAMKPTVVADHGSANTAKYTRANIEIQGLSLWLSGIGRPTGNARTERVIGTLKREEINLQEQYTSEPEAKSSIKTSIWDYNTNRPNAGNGGFAPNAVHSSGRGPLMKHRAKARRRTEALRRKHWERERSPEALT